MILCLAEDFIKNSSDKLNQFKTRKYPTSIKGVNSHLLPKTSSYTNSQTLQIHWLYSIDATRHTQYLPSIYNPFRNRIHGRESETKYNFK